MEIAASLLSYIKACGPVAILILNTYLAWRWRKRLDNRLLNIIALLKVHRQSGLQGTATVLERRDL